MKPALRFPEFDGDWLTAKLGDIFTFKNGVNADKSMYGSGRKFINVMDVIADVPIFHDTIIGNVEISDKEFAKNEVVFGDILFQRSSETREEVGQSNIYLDKKPATFGGFVIRGHPKKPIISRYFDALLKTSSVRKDVTSRSGGSTRYNIGQESLEAVAIRIAPTDAEQQKISDFLIAVDERIKLLQRRRDAVQRYKQGMMQRLFAQSTCFKREDGSAYPDWKIARLGRLGEFSGGGTPDTSVEEYWAGNIPWVSSSDIFEKSIHRVNLVKKISQAALEASATKTIPAGSILIVTRVGVGKVAISPVELCTSQDFSNFTSYSDNVRYLAYWLSFNKNKLLSLSQGTSIKGLTTVDLKGLKIELPHVDEQEKIADLLSAIDDKIAAVSAQVDQMQAFKKGLLQQMFV